MTNLEIAADSIELINCTCGVEIRIPETGTEEDIAPSLIIIRAILDGHRNCNSPMYWDLGAVRRPCFITDSLIEALIKRKWHIPFSYNCDKDQYGVIIPK